MLSQYLRPNVSLFLWLIGMVLCSSSCENQSHQIATTKAVVTDSVQLRLTDSLYRRAKDLYGERKFEEARGLFDLVDTMLLAQERYPTYILSKINKATNLRALQEPEEDARTILKEAVNDVRKIPTETFEIGSLFNSICASYLRTEEYSDAKYYGLKALEVFNHPANEDEKEKTEEILQSYDRLASAEEGLYNYEKSEEYYMMQLDSEKSEFYETRTLAKIFAFFENSNQYDKAKILLDTVSWKHRLEKTSFYENYLFQITKLDYYMALAQYEDALNTATELDSFISNSPYGAHFANWFLDQRLAQINLLMGNYDKVISIVNEAKPSRGEQEMKNKGNTPLLFYQSQAYFKRGEIEKTKKVLQTAINLHLPKNLANADFLAVTPIEAATLKNRMIGKLVFKAEICQSLYASSNEEAYLTAALANYDLVHGLLKEIGASSDEDQFMEDDVFQDFYEEYLGTLHETWKISNKEALFYRAFTVSDEAKNISVLKELKQIKRNKLFRNIPAPIREEQLAFETALDSVSKVIALALDPKKAMQQKDSIELQFQNFKQQLKQDYPNYYSLLYGNQIPLKQVIAERFSEYNVLEYFVGKEHIYIFNVIDGQLTFDKLKFSPALKESLEQLINALRDPTNGKYQNYITPVYDALFAKYHVADKKLALILDGELYALPFEVFSLGKEEMFLKQPTLRLNSVTQYQQLLDSTPSKALAFAPFASSGAEGRSKISNSLQEVEYVMRTFGGAIKLDQEATKEAFLASVSNFPIVHLATHSEVNKKVPLRSAIYFATIEGGLPSEHSMELQELYNMNLSANLVTLSSCETGLGKVVKGKGVQSISNAFNYAGVATTVMSLWKVPDKQTTQIMISFYEHLGAGEAKDEALHKAKLDYLASTSDPNLRHPYYWAGFVISGDTTPMQISTPTNRYVAWGALILGTLGLGLFYFRRKKKLA